MRYDLASLRAGDFDMHRRRLAHRIDLYYPPAESHAANVLQAAIERIVPTICETWGL